MNELVPRPPSTAGAGCARVAGRERIARAYAQYLHDESKLTADHVEAIYFPATAEEVAEAVQSVRRAGHRLNVSGARTGITGGAVPVEAEEIICLERCKWRPAVRRSVDGHWDVHVGAGTTVAELADALDHGLCDYPDGKPERPLFYPVDTTEVSAHLGGTIATNASGARTLYYGPTRSWVDWLKLVTADGRILELRRGNVCADGRLLRYRREDGSSTVLDILDLPMPETKHTAGYYLKCGMDALDLFIGSEGTLGIVVEAELRLAEKPANRLFLTQFVDGPQSAVSLVLACKRHPAITPIALEYIGPRAVALLRSKGKQTPAYLEVSRLPQDARAVVYVEIAFRDEADLDGVYRALQEVLAAAGLRPEHSWAGFADKDMEQMKRLRHAVPETVNAVIAQRQVRVPQLHKVGTDMAVPDEALEEMMQLYVRRLVESKMDHVIFGHIGSGHLHVNILPEAAEELERAEGLYMEFAAEAVRLGGSVAAEHGIGRIKKGFLPLQFKAEHLQAMRAIKHALDPDGILNPGVLFDS